jgi:hypothetical protein
VVAICDHLCFLLCRQLKHEIGGKAVLVALHLLVQALGAYPVELGEIGIQHYLLTANQQDAGFNPLDRNYRLCLRYISPLRSLQPAGILQLNNHPRYGRQRLRNSELSRAARTLGLEHRRVPQTLLFMSASRPVALRALAPGDQGRRSERHVPRVRCQTDRETGMGFGVGGADIAVYVCDPT